MANKKKKSSTVPKEPHCDKPEGHEDATHSFKTLTRDGDAEAGELEPMDPEWVAWRARQSEKEAEKEKDEE